MKRFFLLFLFFQTAILNAQDTCLILDSDSKIYQLIEKDFYLIKKCLKEQFEGKILKSSFNYDNPISKKNDSTNYRFDGKLRYKKNGTCKAVLKRRFRFNFLPSVKFYRLYQSNELIETNRFGKLKKNSKINFLITSDTTVSGDSMIIFYFAKSLYKRQDFNQVFFENHYFQNSLVKTIYCYKWWDYCEKMKVSYNENFTTYKYSYSNNYQDKNFKDNEFIIKISKGKTFIKIEEKNATGILNVYDFPSEFRSRYIWNSFEGKKLEKKILKKIARN